MAGHDKERDRGHDHCSNGSTVQAASAELARQGTEVLRRLSSFLGSTPVAPAVLDHSRTLPQGGGCAAPKKMPRLRLGRAGASRDIPVGLRPTLTIYTCWLTRTLHGGAALP